jgi:hypothetical protein
MDWSKFSDQDLVALKKGDYGSLSNDALLMLKSASSTPMQQIASEAKTPPVDFSWAEMAGNIPSSGRKWAQDTFEGMTQLVTSPIETAKAMGNVALGGVQKLIPGEQSSEPAFNALADFYGQRYGSWDQFKQTAMQDPVGVASDASTALFLGAAPLKAAGTASKIPGAPGLLSSLGGAGNLLGKTAAALDPLNLAWNATGRPAGRLASHAFASTKPHDLWLSAAKLPTTLDDKTPGTRLAIAETALSRNIKPTRKGIAKLDSLLGNVKDQINTRLDALTSAGHVVHKDSLVKYFDELIDDHGGVKLFGGQDKARLLTIKQNFLDHLDEVAPGRIYLRPEEVQKFKTDAWKQAGGKAFGERSLQMDKAAAKAAGRAAKEELEVIDDMLRSQTPGVPLEALNQEYAELAKLRKVLPKPAGRIENRNPTGLGLPVGVGSGAAAGGLMGGPVGAKVGAALGAAQAMFNTPGVMLQMGQGLYNAQNSFPFSLVPKKEWPALARQMMQEAELIRQLEEEIARQDALNAQQPQP